MTRRGRRRRWLRPRRWWPQGILGVKFGWPRLDALPIRDEIAIAGSPPAVAVKEVHREHHGGCRSSGRRHGSDERRRNRFRGVSHLHRAESSSFQIRPCLKRANQASPSRQAHRLCRSHGGDTTLGAARDCDHAAATARGNHRRGGVPATAAARRLPALAQLPRTSKLGERWQWRRHDQEQQAAVFGGIRACARIHSGGGHAARKRRAPPRVCALGLRPPSSPLRQSPSQRSQHRQQRVLGARSAIAAQIA